MNFLTRKHLSRRTFLNGVGVTLALPLLESMLPAMAFGQAAAQARRTRLGCIYVPHGAIMPKWTPEKDGTGFVMSEILQPLVPFQQQVNVVSGLEHKLAYGSGATANHNRSAAAYLSGAFAKTLACTRFHTTLSAGFASWPCATPTPANPMLTTTQR